MVAPVPIKTFGLAVGALLFAYAFVIAYVSQYDEVDNRYATAFSTVGFAIVLVALGGFLAGNLDELLEALGYIVVGGGGTVAFRRITKRPGHFEEA